MISVTPIRLPVPVARDCQWETGGRFFAAARVLLLATLLAGPLAFGAVLPWAWGTMAVVVALLLLVWAAGCVRAGAARLVWSPLYVPGLALLLLAAMQLRYGLSLDRIATREAVIMLVMCLAIFFLSQHLLAWASPQVWRAGAAVVALYAFAMALFAIVQFFASPGLLYGTLKPRWGGYVFGPYVSHNNYAGLMEMLIPIAATYVLSLRPQHPAKPFLTFTILISLVSVFLSGSRGGVISLLVEFAVLAVCTTILRGSAGQRGRSVLVWGFVLATAGGAFFYWLDPGEVWKRWQDAAHTPELALQDRVTMTKDSLRMSRAYLPWGVGLGAFEVAYPKYQTLVTDLDVDYAHDDYVQLVAETGVLGCLLVPLAIGLFLYQAFRSLRSRFEGGIGWMRLGAAIAVCGLLVHSTFDFNLHIPANAAWFALCVAIAVLPARTDRGMGELSSSC